MMVRNVALLALVVALVVSPTVIWAAQPRKVSKLPEVVVTATRIKAPTSMVPRAVSVVGMDRIQMGTQELNLGEALAGVPGLYVQNEYDFAQGVRIALRGFGATSSFGIRGIRIYVDGIPETLPDGQATVNSVDLGSASRIEILRGPASSLYGNAAGGVILITSELGHTPPFVEARVAGGEGGYSQQQIKSAGVLGKVDYLFDVQRTRFDGFRDHSAARGTTVNSKWGFGRGGPDSLIVSLNYTDQPELQDPGGLNATQARVAPMSAYAGNLKYDAGKKIKQTRIGAVYHHRDAMGTLTLRNYYVWRYLTQNLPFNHGGVIGLNRFFLGGGAQYAFAKLPVPLSLTVGVDYDRQNDDRRNYNNNNGVQGATTLDQNELVQSIGFFGEGQYKISRSWSLLAGLRYDRVAFDVTDHYLADGNDSGKLNFHAVSPSLGTDYRVKAGVFYASYSSSFETPTTTELANPNPGGGFNPALKPQKADNIELGYKLSRSRWQADVALFHISLRDAPTPYEIAAYPGRTFYVNAGRSSRQGIETSLVWIPIETLTVDASYTWSDFKYDHFIDQSGTSFNGKWQPGVPRNMAYLSLTYKPFPGFSGTLETQYAGSLYADNGNATKVASHVVTNMRLVQKFGFNRYMLRLYLGINNIFDERYFDNIRINAFGGRYFEPAPGRNIYGGVSLRFS